MSSQKRKIVSASITLLFIVGLFLLRNSAAIETMRSLTVRLFSPFMRSRELTMFREVSAEEARNSDYITSLEYTVSLLREENDVLKKALSLADARRLRIGALPVLAYIRELGHEYLLIDFRPSTAALRQGSLILTQNGIVIGRIKEISGSVAKVEIASVSDEVFDAVGDSGTRVLAKGIGGRTMQVELISAQSPLTVGEFIGVAVSSSTAPLPLAKIVKLEQGDSKTFQNGTALLLARPELMREVFYIIP